MTDASSVNPNTPSTAGRPRQFLDQASRWIQVLSPIIAVSLSIAARSWMVFATWAGILIAWELHVASLGRLLRPRDVPLTNGDLRSFDKLVVMFAVAAWALMLLSGIERLTWS